MRNQCFESQPRGEHFPEAPKRLRWHELNKLTDPLLSLHRVMKVDGKEDSWVWGKKGGVPFGCKKSFTPGARLGKSPQKSSAVAAGPVSVASRSGSRLSLAAEGKGSCCSCGASNRSPPPRLSRLRQPKRLRAGPARADPEIEEGEEGGRGRFPKLPSHRLTGMGCPWQQEKTRPLKKSGCKKKEAQGILLINFLM